MFFLIENPNNTGVNQACSDRERVTLRHECAGSIGMILPPNPGSGEFKGWLHWCSGSPSKSGGIAIHQVNRLLIYHLSDLPYLISASALYQN